jgi:uncharacterized protein YukJ
MPLKKYGVLKGSAVDRRLGAGQSPHYQVRLVAGGADYRIAINVQSKLAPSELEYLVDEQFRHPIIEALPSLAPGFTAIPRGSGVLGLDFIRGNLFDRERMTPLPHDVVGPDNDLNEKLDHYFERALRDEEAVVYAFGEPWGPEPASDKYFGFRPGRGIHDIHMNQGNHPSFASQDGTWQDGAVLIHFPSRGQWVGIFLKFQSQSWHTDDRTGHAVSEEELPETRPDGLVRIVAALVNGTQTPEQESITLLNTSPGTVSLDGWVLVDKQKHRQPLSGAMAPGATRQLPVAKPLELSNQGGLISLLDDQGLKVDGVSYVKGQVSRPGWTLVF